MTARSRSALARALGALFALGLAAELLASQSSCSACDTSGQDPIDYSQGTTSGKVYETSPATGEWLHFPPGRRFRLHHGLGTDQLSVDASVAFSEHPLHRPEGGDDAGAWDVGNTSPAAGNEVIVERQDADAVQVRNDTCATYYLRVVVTAR